MGVENKSDYFELSKLKRRYTKGTKQVYTSTLSTSLINAMGIVVPVGNGKYGSALLELSAWMLIALTMSGEDLDSVANDLAIMNKSPYLVNNLRRLLHILEK